MTEHARMTPDAVAIGAYEHALRLGHSYLGSEHFLLALAYADQPAVGLRDTTSRRNASRRRSPAGPGPVRRPRPGRASGHRDRRQRRARLDRSILRTESPDFRPARPFAASLAFEGCSLAACPGLARRGFPPALPQRRAESALHPRCGAGPARHPTHGRAPRSRPPRRQRRSGAFHPVTARRVSGAVARRDPRPLPAGEVLMVVGWLLGLAGDARVGADFTRARPGAAVRVRAPFR